MSEEINPYNAFGRMIHQGFQHQQMKTFISSFVQNATKAGKKRDDAIMLVKNFIGELHDSAITICVQMQSISEKSDTQDDPSRVTVREASIIVAVSPATIRNWIKDPTNPLPSLNAGNRKTTVLISDLTKRMVVESKIKRMPM